MEIYRLAYWLDYVFSSFVMIDGYLFFKARSMALDDLIAKVRSHESPERAQYWMNIVLLEDFISEASGDRWESFDPPAQWILSTVKDAWSAQVRASFPGVDFTIHTAIDDEAGDFGLRLSSDFFSLSCSLDPDDHLGTGNEQ
jgi:hypothetical protein